MEIEVKLRLPTEEDTAKLERSLGCPLHTSEDQENVFYDGANRELIGQGLVFRIRLIQKQDREPIAVVALKGNAVLVDGIASVEEEEEEISLDLAKQIIEDPNHIHIVAQSHHLLRKIVERGSCKGGFIQVGRFRNERHKYRWNEYTVEVDRTTYPHGVAYEVEIESTDPVLAKERITALMHQNGISFGNSQRNKFENMVLGSVL
ncbi:hypothetical protein BGW38_004562 [Lunasporangiospora selenospora]|uniref:CYTH domain-containing protein n=1 Tax=Lunasporangiospora selenospora TaxID=979761 RepID=A0A9P6FZY9_9FUNG|nr:hypothetical protein BGW38_004562 [Lunasporangiospora selenospora]